MRGSLPFPLNSLQWPAAEAMGFMYREGIEPRFPRDGLPTHANHYHGMDGTESISTSLESTSSTSEQHTQASHHPDLGSGGAPGGWTDLMAQFDGDVCGQGINEDGNVIPIADPGLSGLSNLHKPTPGAGWGLRDLGSYILMDKV